MEVRLAGVAQAVMAALNEGRRHVAAWQSKATPGDQQAPPHQLWSAAAWEPSAEPREEDIAQAAALKAEGTAAFGKKDFRLAVERYGASLAVLRDPVVLVNLAACHLKLDEPEECVTCCKEFLSIRWRHELFGDEEKRRLLSCKAFFRWSSALFDLDCPLEAVRAMQLSLAHCSSPKLFASLQGDYRTMIMAALENHGLVGGFGWVPPTVWSSAPAALRARTWCGKGDTPLALPVPSADGQEARLLFCEAHQLSSVVSLLRTVGDWTSGGDDSAYSELMVDLSVPNAVCAARLLVLLALAADTSFAGSHNHGFEDLAALWAAVASSRHLPAAAGQRLHTVLEMLTTEGARGKAMPFLVLSDANVLGIEQAKYVLDACLELDLQLVLTSWKAVLAAALDSGAPSVPNVTTYDPVARQPLELADFPALLFPEADDDSDRLEHVAALLRPFTAVLPLVYRDLVGLSRADPMLAAGAAGQLYLHVIIGDAQAIVVPTTLYSNIEHLPDDESDGAPSDDDEASGDQMEAIDEAAMPHSIDEADEADPATASAEDPSLAGAEENPAEAGTAAAPAAPEAEAEEAAGQGASEAAGQAAGEAAGAAAGEAAGGQVSLDDLCGGGEQEDEEAALAQSRLPCDSGEEMAVVGPRYCGMNLANLVDYVGLLNLQPFFDSLLPGGWLLLCSYYGGCGSWPELVRKATVEVFHEKTDLFEAIAGLLPCDSPAPRQVRPASRPVALGGVELAGAHLVQLLCKRPPVVWSVQAGVQARACLLELFEDVTYAERAPLEEGELGLRLLPTSSPLSFMQMLSAGEARVQEGGAAWQYGCLQAVLQALQKDNSIHLIGLASLCGGFQGGLRLSLASHEEDEEKGGNESPGIRMPSILSQCGRLRAYVATVQYTSAAWRDVCTPAFAAPEPGQQAASLVIQAVMHTDVGALCKKSGAELWAFFSGEADGAVIQQIDAGLLLLPSGHAIFRFSEVMIDGDGTGERPQLLLLDLLSCSIVGQLVQPALVE